MWTIADFTGERPLYRSSSFECWEARSPRYGERLLVTLGGAPEIEDAAVHAKVRFLDQHVVAVEAVETVEVAGGEIQLMIERRPEGEPLTALAPLSEPDAARLLGAVAGAATRARTCGRSLVGLCPQLCFADPETLALTGVSPHAPLFAGATRLSTLPRPWRDPIYMAPELLDGGAIEPANMLYSIGLLAAFLLTGEHPYPMLGSETFARMLTDGPIEVEASDGFAALIRALTARDPSARPEPFEVEAWLEPIAAGEAVDLAAETRRIELRRSIEVLTGRPLLLRSAADLERRLPRVAELPEAGARAGLFVLEHLVAGSVADPDRPLAVPEAVWRGRDPASPDRSVLISVSSYRFGFYGDRRAALALEVDGVAPMLYLGPVIDAELALDALVELEPPGAPIDRLAPVDEIAAARLCAELAGLAAAAAARGQVLAGLRPERVYVSSDGRLVGVAPRGEELFEMPGLSRRCLAECYPRLCCYPGRYGAPERVPRVHDWRSGLGPAADVFSIAAIGHFLVTGDHRDWTAEPAENTRVSWPAPRLQALLAPALSEQPEQRPDAAQLAVALAAIGRGR